MQQTLRKWCGERCVDRVAWQDAAADPWPAGRVFRRSAFKKSFPPGVPVEVINVAPCLQSANTLCNR